MVKLRVFIWTVLVLLYISPFWGNFDLDILQLCCLRFSFWQAEMLNPEVKVPSQAFFVTVKLPRGPIVLLQTIPYGRVFWCTYNMLVIRVLLKSLNLMVLFPSLGRVTILKCHVNLRVKARHIYSQTLLFTQKCEWLPMRAVLGCFILR